MFKRFKNIACSLETEIRVYQLALADPRVGVLPKCLLGLAIAYFLSPIDLIPDFIPFIGYLDDLLIVPTLIMIALWMIPREVISDCRNAISRPSDNIESQVGN